MVLQAAPIAAVRLSGLVVGVSRLGAAPKQKLKVIKHVSRRTNRSEVQCYMQYIDGRKYNAGVIAVNVIICSCQQPAEWPWSTIGGRKTRQRRHKKPNIPSSKERHVHPFSYSCNELCIQAAQRIRVRRIRQDTASRRTASSRQTHEPPEVYEQWQRLDRIVVCTRHQHQLHALQEK